MGGVSRRAQPHNIYQADLFAGSSPLQTKLITRRKDFDELFDGFHKMRAISYVISPDLLLEFFDQRGYTELEVVVGANLSEVYRKDLEQKGVEVTDRLAELVEKDKLRVFISARTIHTKLYILGRDDIVRVIQTSANLTLTAQEARQINYVWYLDIPPGNPILEQLVQDYQSHLDRCSLFMGDLKDLLNQRSDMDRKQVIEAWLKGVAVEEQDVEIRGIFHDLSVSLVEAAGAKEERVTVLQLPESGVQRRRVERLLKPLNPVSAGHNQMQVNTSAYVRYVYETHRIPLLIVSQERRQLLLGLDGLVSLAKALPGDPALINEALELMEDYLNTVDFGESSDRKCVKTSMFEALLYIFFTPFAHEYMKAKRIRYGRIDMRGPRFLYIYGPSENGKTTFLRFALKLLTRKEIEPLSHKDFTETKINNIIHTETAFPLVFDDINPSHISGMEEVFKSYWERWWRAEYSSPQIVLASNIARLKDWAKSRVKRVDFDIHFAPTETDKERLNKVFSKDNPIFSWFSYLYLHHLSNNESFSDDELWLARVVMKELYQSAKRPLPEFFPTEPIEKLYNPGRKDWRELLYELPNRPAVKKEGNRKFITFSKDVQPWEIADYLGYLPQTIKHRRKGNTIIVENPTEFDEWLGQAQPRPLFRHLFKSKDA